jgi:anti-anti-sigma factor
MLRVIIQHLGERAVICCVGRIVAGREANTLREAVLSQRKRGAVMLDLTRVDAVDGGGIGLLVFLQSWARAVGINLQLLNPAPHVRELLQLTNLDSVFKILSSADPVSSLAEAF